jgi:hypothetical protein
LLYAGILPEALSKYRKRSLIMMDNPTARISPHPCPGREVSKVILREEDRFFPAFAFPEKR